MYVTRNSSIVFAGLMILVGSLVLSCKDDEEEAENQVPQFLFDGSSVFYKFAQDEGVVTGTLIGKVSAQDPEKSTLTYSFSTPNDTFLIDQSEGAISNNIVFDYEALSQSQKENGFALRIEATDKVHKATAVVVIKINDVDEPTAPTDPTNPTDPTVPTDPTDPTAPTNPTVPPGGHPFDEDQDGLIGIYNLDQLNAIRYDLDGNGEVDASNQPAFLAAFQSAAPGTYKGYELMNALDFEHAASYASGAVNTVWVNPVSGGAPNTKGWMPIGVDPPYNSILEGNGHIISHLYIHSSQDLAGLIAQLGANGTVVRLGLQEVQVNVTSSLSGNIFILRAVAALVARNQGRIAACFATGNVIGHSYKQRLGGLVGENSGLITSSYTTTHVAAKLLNVAVGINDVRQGAFVGENNGGTIKACYATGNITFLGRLITYGGGFVGYSNGDIEASYSTGALLGLENTVGPRGPRGFGAGDDFLFATLTVITHCVLSKMSCRNQLLNYSNLLRTQIFTLNGT